MLELSLVEWYCGNEPTAVIGKKNLAQSVQLLLSQRVNEWDSNRATLLLDLFTTSAVKLNGWSTIRLFYYLAT